MSSASPWIRPPPSETTTAVSDGAPHSPLDALLGATPRRVARHWLSLLLLALAGAGALVFLVRFVSGDDAPFYSAAVERGDLVPLVSESGMIRGSGEVTVRAMLGGRVLWVSGAAEGRVQEGEVLARIDAAEVRRRIAGERSRLTATEAELEAARVSAGNVAARLARFETVWRRSGGRAPSLNEMEAARSEAERARLAVEAAEARMAAARAELREAEAKAAGAQVRAPIAGLLVLRNAQPGAWVSEGQQLFTIAPDGAPLTIEVPLFPSRTGPLGAGTAARIRIDALRDQVQQAKLSLLRVPPPPRNAPPIAVFALQNPDPRVRPGMAATVEIELPARKNVLLVPDAALAFDPTGANTSRRKRARIYLLSEDGKPRRVYITAGGSDGERTEVFGTGIRPGDQVITGWRGPAAPARTPPRAASGVQP